MDEKIVNKRFPGDKRFVKIGDKTIDLGVLLRDPRDMIENFREIIKEDWIEGRFLEWDTQLHPNAEASELSIQDRYVLDIYEPLYTSQQHVCSDCSQGPCDLKENKGNCGLTLEAYQGKISLKVACRGARAQIMEAREILTECIKTFGRDKAVSHGERHDMADFAVCIGQITGIYAKTIAELEKVMAYVDAELNKLEIASTDGVSQKAFDFEAMSFHMGTVLFVAQEVSELLKVNCFGAQSSGQHDKLEMRNWPPANILGGMGNIDKSKPVIAFIGDNVIPGWTTVNYLKENKLTDNIEICGMGSVGLDIIRFYDKAKVISSTASAPRAIRLGFADVIVASVGCMNLDLLKLAAKGGSKLIWVSVQPIGIDWIRDRTDDPIDLLVDDLSKKVDAIWCRDMDKVADIAVRVAQAIKSKRKPWEDYLIPEAQAKKEAAKCREDCDLCFNACPYAIQLGKALRKVKTDGLAAMEEAEKRCVLCEKCEGVCPEKIKITDIMVRVAGKWSYPEKYKMRAGRGAVPEDETARAAFTLSNSPGFVRVLSCGGSKQITDEVCWMVNALISRNCVTSMAGCGGAEVAKYFDEEQQKFFYDIYPGEYLPRNAIYHGSCSAHCLMTESSAHWARTGVHISHYANFIQVADVVYRLMRTPSILWGQTPDRMFSIASGLARTGETVIVGPVSGYEWNRFLLGNQYDRSKWHIWDTATGRNIETEPNFEHLIIPVETKEEALVMLFNCLFHPSDISTYRILRFTRYLEDHQNWFGELPDNWFWFVKTNADLPIKMRSKLLKVLREQYGWETDYARVFKAKHRDGRLLDVWTFNREYGIAEARYFTHTPELLSRKGKSLLSEEEKTRLRKEGYKI